MTTDSDDDRLTTLIAAAGFSLVVPGSGLIGSPALLEDAGLSDEDASALRTRGALWLGVGLVTCCGFGLVNLLSAWDTWRQVAAVHERLPTVTEPWGPLLRVQLLKGVFSVEDAETDSRPEGWEGSPTPVHRAAADRLWLQTPRAAGHIPVRVELHDEAPPRPDRWAPCWDAAVEVPSGRLSVGGDRHFENHEPVEVGPGTWQVRVVAMGLETARHDDSLGDESFRIQLWPGEDRPVAAHEPTDPDDPEMFAEGPWWKRLRAASLLARGAGPDRLLGVLAADDLPEVRRAVAEARVRRARWEALVPPLEDASMRERVAEALETCEHADEGHRSLAVALATIPGDGDPWTEQVARCRAVRALRRHGEAVGDDLQAIFDSDPEEEVRNYAAEQLYDLGRPVDG